MLVRLNFELAERKRCARCSGCLSVELTLLSLHRLDEEKKQLGAQKTKLVRENEVKKARLEDLEKQLDEFVAVRSTFFPAW